MTEVIMVVSPELYWSVVIIATLLAAAITLIWRAQRRRQAGEQLAMKGATLSPTFGERWLQAARQLWREDIRAEERHRMQVAVSLACVFISLSIGYSYARIAWIDGWQLWTWALCVIILVVALWPANEWPRSHLSEWKVVLALGAIALLLRLLLLEMVPGGLHVDEMGVADFAARHVFPPGNQTINPFHTGAASQPALYHYLIRLSFALFGYSIWGLRVGSVVAGTLAVLATYAVVAVWQDRRTALLAAAVMATYHYHIHWSRLGLNNVWDTLWVPLILAAFTWGWQRQWSGGAVIAGLALGLSQYFYAGSKVGIFLLAYAVYVLYRRTPDQRRLLIHGGKLLVTAATVAAPIALFAMLMPEVYFQRSRIVFGWQYGAIIEAVGEYNLGQYLWQQIWRNAGAFTAVPEITGFYGPDVPFLIGLAAPLFVIGFLWSLWQHRWLPVLWVLLTILFGGIMLTGAPSSSHFVVVIPAICWLTAVPLGWLWQRGHWKTALLLLAAIMATDLIFYFGIYVLRPPRDLFNPMPPWPFG